LTPKEGSCYKYPHLILCRSLERQRIDTQFTQDKNNTHFPKGELMNKSELIDAIAESSGLTKADSGRALEGFISAVTGALSRGDSVTLVGFGTFAVKERAERVGRNPQTGTEITIKAAKMAKFKAGKSLTDAVK
jgi:DNA-binding protein HU-beta